MLRISDPIPKTPRRLGRQKHSHSNHGEAELRRSATAGMNCHGFQAVVSDRKTPSEAACRRQDLSRVSHAPGLCWRCGTPRSASLHVGLNACHRPRKAEVASEAFASFAAFTLRPLRFLLFEVHVTSLCTLHVDQNAKDAKAFTKFTKTLPRNPSTLRPSRASLCDLCVSCRSTTQCLFTFRSGFNAKNAKMLRKVHKDATAKTS